MPKTALVLRWGAFGDMLMATTVFPVLKEDGYHLTVNTTERGLPILKNNPHVDDIVIYESESIPRTELEEYWNELAKGYDKFVNLSESVEATLLMAEGSSDFELPKWVRSRRAGFINYYDAQLAVAGYPHITGRNAEMYYSSMEHKLAKKERNKHKGFLILWALSGSSMHKSYPYTEYVLAKLMETYEDISVIFVGDIVCQLLVSKNWKPHLAPRIKNACGHWPVRKSLIMTEYADLVVGPETGVLNAAGGLDVPKIIFLSHSSHDNLSKHWRNTVPLWADVFCYPCHQLHYSLESCPLDPHLGTPICMAKLEAKVVYNAIETKYLEWKNARLKKANHN